MRVCWIGRGEAAPARASWDQILPAIHRGIITSGITILYQGAYSPTREEVNGILAADKTLRG